MFGSRSLRSIAIVGAMVASLMAVAPSQASPNWYVTMTDGVQIAINISCPHPLDDPPISVTSTVSPDGDLNCPGQPAGPKMKALLDLVFHRRSDDSSSTYEDENV